MRLFVFCILSKNPGRGARHETSGLGAGAPGCFAACGGRNRRPAYIAWGFHPTPRRSARADSAFSAAGTRKPSTTSFQAWPRPGCRSIKTVIYGLHRLFLLPDSGEICWRGAHGCVGRRCPRTPPHTPASPTAAALNACWRAPLPALRAAHPPARPPAPPFRTDDSLNSAAGSLMHSDRPGEAVGFGENTGAAVPTPTQQCALPPICPRTHLAHRPPCTASPLRTGFNRAVEESVAQGATIAGKFYPAAHGERNLPGSNEG